MQAPPINETKNSQPAKYTLPPKSESPTNIPSPGITSTQTRSKRLDNNSIKTITDRMHASATQPSKSQNATYSVNAEQTIFRHNNTIDTAGQAQTSYTGKGSYKTQDIVNNYKCSLDDSSREELLKNARTLPQGISRHETKNRLGRPTRESTIALAETKELAKLLIYKLKSWQKGLIEKENTEEQLILVFNQNDSLISMEYKGGTDQT
jgi:hypothetical protein